MKVLPDALACLSSAPSQSCDETSLSLETVATTPACGAAMKINSDEMLAAFVSRRLTSAGAIPIQKLGVQFRNGHVVLTGEVASYYIKQLAQQVVMAMEGVRALENHLSVK